MELIILWFVIGAVAGIGWQLYARIYNAHVVTFKLRLFMLAIMTIAGVFTLIGLVSCIVQDNEIAGD